MAELRLFITVLLFVTGLSVILFTAKKQKLYAFLSVVIFAVILSAFGTRIFFNFNFKFGEADLIEFARQEKALGHNLYVVNNPRKYSVLYYGDKVQYIKLKKKTPKLKKTHLIFSSESRAIIKNKDYKKISEKYNIEVIQKGRKYSIVQFR